MRKCCGLPCTTLTMVRIFILTVCLIGLMVMIAGMTVLMITNITVRCFIVAIGILMLLVSGVAWKATEIETTGTRPVNAVFLQAYRAEHFDRMETCATRHPAFIPFPVPPNINIPRPLVSHDPFGPPTILAPPPPTYTQSERHCEEAVVATVPSVAPPVYSVCGAIGRTATHSPPPFYSAAMATPSSLPPPFSEEIVSIIDCSKAVPTTFRFQANQCSSI